MKINRRSETIGVMSFFALLLIVGNVQAVSVEVSGWNFTADLGNQWHSGDPQAVENDENSLHGVAGDSSWTWRGVMLNNAFWLPREGTVIDLKNDPGILSLNQNNLLATADISVHRVPADMQDMDALTKLKEFNGPDSNYPSDSIKEIEFNGHQARLYEIDSPDQYGLNVITGEKSLAVPAHSSGTIDVMMADDTMVTIDVTTRPDSGLRAWDVIEKFTITPK